MENIISYKNTKVYIGIDVHKKTYTWSAFCEGMIVKTVTTPARCEEFALNLKKWFGEGEIYSVYEAGFSGFRLHRVLESVGIKNIVINPASLEIAAKDKVKTDRRDSKKLAEQLGRGRLHGIHIPTEKEELSRLITRTREQIVEEQVRVANQIKGRLHFFNLLDTDDNSVVRESFLKKIETWGLPAELKYSLDLLVAHWRFLDQQLEDLKIEMKAQSFEDSYNEGIYQSIPGVGDIVREFCPTNSGISH